MTGLQALAATAATVTAAVVVGVLTAPALGIASAVLMALATVPGVVALAALFGVRDEPGNWLVVGTFGALSGVLFGVGGILAAVFG